MINARIRDPQTAKMFKFILTVVVGVFWASSNGSAREYGMLNLYNVRLIFSQIFNDAIYQQNAESQSLYFFNVTEKSVYLSLSESTFAKVSAMRGIVVTVRESDVLPGRDLLLSLVDPDAGDPAHATVSAYSVPLGAFVFYGKWITPSEVSEIRAKFRDRCDTIDWKQGLAPDTVPATVKRLMASRLEVGRPRNFGEPIKFEDSLLCGKEDDLKVTSAGCLSIVKDAQAIAIDEASGVYRWINNGSFTRATSVPGSSRSPVVISSGFWCGITELTQGQFRYWKDRPLAASPQLDFPQAYIDWPTCDQLVRSLRSKYNRLYDLPTESEWEYVAQAGRLREFGAAGDVEDIGWFSTNSGRKVHRVATRRANDWGIYDMHGNLREWCRDWYSFRPPEGVDPTGPATGGQKVVRGGSFQWEPKDCRSGSRDSCDVENAAEYLGVRLVVRTKAMNPPPEAPAGSKSPPALAPENAPSTPK